ncbi:FAD dependent oxidoreductase [Penicillium sp. IBT 18751x]|nr:FAD dependent oxidoreductase [Penicillium sp. IBT 18751x]
MFKAGCPNTLGRHGVDFQRWLKIPQGETALTTSADAAHSEHEIVFVMPRNYNIMLVGGIAKSHEWNLSLTLDSPIPKRMRARYEFFLLVLSLQH